MVCSYLQRGRYACAGDSADVRGSGLDRRASYGSDADATADAAPGTHLHRDVETLAALYSQVSILHLFLQEVWYTL